LSEVGIEPCFNIAPTQTLPVIVRTSDRPVPHLMRCGFEPFWFFVEDPWQYWVTAQRSGFMPQHFGPPLIWVGLLLPALVWRGRSLPPAQRLQTALTPLPQVALASFGLFLAAHALLFKLYFPGRYTQHSLRVVMALSAGLALAILLDSLSRWASGREQARVGWRAFTASIFMAALGAALILYPDIAAHTGSGFPLTRYRVGEQPVVYEFLASQPRDILVASVSDEANYLPPFAKRSIVFGDKYAALVSVEFRRQMHERAIDVMRGNYSPDLRDAQAIIRKYGVTFWLVRRSSFSPTYVRESWMMAYQPEVSEVLASLTLGIAPALARTLGSCSVFSSSGMVVLQAECILAIPPADLAPASTPP